MGSPADVEAYPTTASADSNDDLMMDVRKRE
jgi:hypothetical protein